MAHNGSDIMLLMAFRELIAFFLLACRCVYCGPFSFSFGFCMDFFATAARSFFLAFDYAPFAIRLVYCCPFCLLLSVWFDLLHKKKGFHLSMKALNSACAIGTAIFLNAPLH